MPMSLNSMPVSVLMCNLLSRKLNTRRQCIMRFLPRRCTVSRPRRQRLLIMVPNILEDESDQSQMTNIRYMRSPSCKDGNKDIANHSAQERINAIVADNRQRATAMPQQLPGMVSFHLGHILESTNRILEANNLSSPSRDSIFILDHQRWQRVLHLLDPQR